MVSGSPCGDRPCWQQAVVGLCILSLIILAPVALPYFLHPAPAISPAHAPVHVKILAVNDFHGQLPAGQKLNSKPAGSAPVLASYLKAAKAGAGQAATFIALPGDLVGASPPESGLLLDEPAMLFFNGFANGCCGQEGVACSASCNMVATFGNHEFDKGVPELMRKVNGGDGMTTVAHLVDPYPGAKAGYICSNVVWKTNSTPIVAPYVIRDAGGVKIAFIGADTTKTPSLEMPVNVAGVTFQNETESVNRYVSAVQKEGVHAIVVLLHEGGTQDAYVGPTREGCNVTGSVTGIVAGLDPDVDVVLSGHTHAFTNAYLPNAGGKPVLVTQAYSYSRAFADVDLVIDPATGEITDKSAQIVPAYADTPPGITPDPAAAAFLAEDERVVAPLTGRVIAVAAHDISGKETDAGESALGDLVADGQRAAMHADVAFVTTGSLRADIAQGNVTWGNLYTVQPFSATVLSMTMTGAQVRSVLEQQWQQPLPPHNLAVSGLSYTFDESRPAGSRVVSIAVNGTPLDDTAKYTAAMVDYLASGGDGYTVFTKGTDVVNGPVDVDALVTYMGSLPQPVNPPAGGRITKAV
jgi:5'-nucleotidase